MYTIGELAKLSGVTNRTLRYYDKIGLLKPLATSDAGYRIYGQDELDLLQQILFYREMSLPLEEIKDLIYSADFDAKDALTSHLHYLSKERQRIDRLIGLVERTIQNQEGVIHMTDQEKFEAFKKDFVSKNEQEFGEEIREKYGEATIDAANERVLNTSQVEWDSIEALNSHLNEKLAEATKENQPESALAQEVCDLHKQWLSFYLPEGQYSSEMHRNLVEMYVADERFKSYYDAIEPGAAVFLHAAMQYYLDK